MARNRFTPKVTVDAPNSPAITASGLRYSTKRASHEVAVLRATQSWINIQTLPSGAPMHINWETPQGSRDFYGYVHSHARHGGLSVVYLAGATWPLKVGGNSVWYNRSADSIVTEILNKFGLEAVVEPHPYMYKYLAQKDLSYWGVLQFLASQTGYVLHVEQTRVYFVTWEYWIKHQQGRAAYFKQNAKGGSTARSDSTLLDFTPYMADTNPEAGANASIPVISSKDANGNPFTVVGNGRPSTYISGRARAVDDYSYEMQVNDPGLAQTLVNAWDSDNRFTHQANVTLAGNPTVQSEQLLYLDGLGTMTGLWTALEMHHYFNQTGSYEIRGVVGSDGVPNANPAMSSLNQSSLTDAWKLGQPLNLDTIGAGFTAPPKVNLRSLREDVLPVSVNGSSGRWCAV